MLIVTLLLMNLLLSIVVDAYSNVKADQRKSDADTESIGKSSFVWISMVWTDARHAKACFGVGGGAVGAKARLAAAGELVPFFESQEELSAAMAVRATACAIARPNSVTGVALASRRHGVSARRMRFKVRSSEWRGSFSLGCRVTVTRFGTRCESFARRAGQAPKALKLRDWCLPLPDGLGFDKACVEIRTTKQCRALLDELGLPQWKIGSVLRSVTIRRVKQLKRDFTPVGTKVEALSEGVDEMRKARRRRVLLFVFSAHPSSLSHGSVGSPWSA